MPRVVERRERVVECMEGLDNSGEHEKWGLALAEIRRPGTGRAGGDLTVDEALLGIVMDGTV